MGWNSWLHQIIIKVIPRSNWGEKRLSSEIKILIIFRIAIFKHRICLTLLGQSQGRSNVKLKKKRLGEENPDSYTFLGSLNADLGYVWPHKVWAKVISRSNFIYEIEMCVWPQLLKRRDIPRSHMVWLMDQSDL